MSNFKDSDNEVNNTFKFNNDILNNLLANIKDNDDNNIESYLEEYNSEIDVEIDQDEQDNIGDDKRNTNNKCNKELDELIPDDEFNEFIQESSALTPYKKLKKFNEAIIQHRRYLSCKKDITFFSCGKGCNNHSWLINGRNIQIPCNGLVRCNVLKEFSTTSVTLCKCVFNEIEQPRCICYERLGGHIHVCTGRGHQSNCIHDGLHKQDIMEGVCNLHFLYDQNQIHNSKDKKLKKFNEAIIQHRRYLSCKKDITFFSCGKGCNNHSWLINGRNIQIPCNGLVRCNVLKEFSTTSVTLCKCVFNEIEQPRCICYERLGGHIHVCTGRGHQSNCIHDGLHKQDIMEGIKCIANWLIGISNTNDELKKKEILNSIIEALIPFIPTSIIKITLSNYTSFQASNNLKKNHNKTPSLFIIQILFSNNFVNKEIQIEENIKSLGQKFGIKLWKSHKEIIAKKDSLKLPKSLFEYYQAFPNFITKFFRKIFIEIFNKKLAVSNRQKKHRKQPEKTLLENKIIKIVTFFVSVLIEITFPSCNIWLTNMLSSLVCKPKLISSLHHLFTTLNVIGHSERHERNQEKKKMNQVDPTQNLHKETNIWNLGVIDNIDFKQKTFSFGNIYDTTQGSSYATLRMIFQSKIPENLIIQQEKVINLEENMQIFEFEHSCQGPSSKVTILEPSDNPNSDQAIFESTKMYKRNLNLSETEYYKFEW
ncbi:hypothetical protein Glove_217g154 [Diversispora epigaea]|uniref:Uncharacterized protein n=1 Tax=Diversispora epigaea TaxID=1348612 RepID=A0A397IGS9_9GLOM|nr:hypothetical protein Glove_217g154 [Diversispora epigaea]